MSGARLKQDRESTEGNQGDKMRKDKSKFQKG